MSSRRPAACVRACSVEAAGTEVYAAGGVRDAADLRALAAAGIAGALVASSLHNGRITAEDLRPEKLK